MEEKARKSMEQVVYEKLKEAILQRMLAPGTQLIENSVSEKLNASRTPIRSAMKRLAAEGYINLIPNRGAFVIQPSKEEILQAFEIRTELESMAFRFSAEKLTGEDIEELKALIEKESTATLSGDIPSYFSANKAFHMFFAEKSENKFICEFIEKIIDRINIYLQLYDTYYNVKPEEVEGVNGHSEILELILKKDFNAAESLLGEHINRSLNFLRIDKIVYKSLEDIFSQ